MFKKHCLITPYGSHRAPDLVTELAVGARFLLEPSSPSPGLLDAEEAPPFPQLSLVAALSLNLPWWSDFSILPVR